MRRVVRSGCHAFSLLELGIAGSVLSVALLGLLATIAFTTRSDINCEESTIALHGVRERLEILEASPFASLAAASGTTYAIDNTNSLLDRLVPAPGRSQVVSVTVSQVTSGNPDLLEVVVQADWQGAMGVRTLRVRTRIANH
ncbi:MAG: hypothetical protein HYZ53_30760 [Planctomycetes bacterium]|nr:hypothetical protein [Planctomycetota bacterium]